MPNKIIIDWNSRDLDWDVVTASLSALMEYENPPTTQIALSVKGKPTLAALQAMLEKAKESGADCGLKVTATFDDSKQLRLFGPSASESLATLTDIDEFLKGPRQDTEY